MYLPAEKRFVIVNRITIVLLYVVILAGGVVRSTGSGMGCPDWPKCFNRFIPPTHISQLPEGYEQEYIEERATKNSRFANTIAAIGFERLANKIRHDESILQPEVFNAAKTWTEYVNRLTSVFAGIFMLLCAVLSFTYLRNRKRIFFLSVLNLFFLVFQAWLGSIVVSTNLTPWVITVHMLIALLIVAITIYTYFQARVIRDKSIVVNQGGQWSRILAFAVIVLTIIQVVLGTEVREEIDFISSTLTSVDRSLWISRLGASFIWHRELALAVGVFNVLLFLMIRTRFAKDSSQSYIANAIVILLVVQIVSGLILAYMGVPAVMQTVHLVVGALTFGIQFYLILILGKASHYIGI